MKELTLDATTALDRALDALSDDLGELENAAAPPTQDGGTLVKRLEATRKTLTDHFRLEEHNGYMETVRTRSPHLSHTIDKLREEHAALLHGIQQLVATAHTGQSIDGDFPTKLREFIERVRDHEARENLLIEESLNRETGAED